MHDARVARVHSACDVHTRDQRNHLVVWLSALTGSLVTATLIVSGLCFLLAGAIYALALRAPIDRIQDQVETVYDVAHAAKTGYEWLSGKLQLFLAVREELRKE